MLNKLSIYNNKIYLATDCYLIVYSHKNSPESQEKKFLECFKIKLPLKFSVENNIGIKLIQNSITGFKSLIVVQYNSESPFNVYIYSNAFRKKLYQIKLPDWSAVLDVCSTDVFVSDGPSFLFHCRNTIHLYSVPKNISIASHYKSFASGYKEYKILQFKCFGPFKSLSQEQFLFLLVVSCNFSNHQTIKILGYVSGSNDSFTDWEQFSSKSFFPDCFEDVLKAIEITKAIPDYKHKCISIRKLKWLETECAICTENNFFMFSNAILKLCCKLPVPMSDITRLETEFNITCWDNVSLILNFENRMVVFLRIRKCSSCEVVKWWTDIEETIVGDVLMKGSKEVILLKETEFDSWQNSCIIYDLSAFAPVDLSCNNVVPDACLKTTISGLEKKVYIGKSAIRDVEHEISQKSAATIDALIKLNEFKGSTQTLKYSKDFQETLIDLILSKDENKMEVSSVTCEPSVKLLGEKQEIVDKHWIISLDFIHEGEKSICNPSIKAVMKDRQISCAQKLFVYKTDTDVLSCASIRQIDSKTKFSIVLSCDFSAFLANEDVNMILSWYIGSTDEFDNEVFLKEDKKVLNQNQICIRTRITLTEIMKYQRKRGFSAPYDLLVARSLQQRIILSISSLHSDIHKLDQLLIQNEPNSTFLQLIESPLAKCILFSDESSLLFGVHIIIHKSLVNEVEIEGFTKNAKEISLLVHYLYDRLPQDIIISPTLNFKNDVIRLKKNVVFSMKSEMDLLLTSFHAYNVPDEMRKNYEKLLSSQTVGTIMIPKEMYQRIRTALSKKESITDTIFKNINMHSMF